MFVRDFMTLSPVCLRPESDPLAGIALCKSGRFRHLPVVDTDGCVLGVVSRADLELFLAEAESPGVIMRRYRVDQVNAREIPPVEPDVPLEEAARLAEKENRADVIAGVDLKSEPDDVAGILIDLAERETKSLSIQFAHKLAGEMKAVTRMHKKPLKSAGFRVLKAPDVPSVLLELGFLSNPDDEKELTSAQWRDRMAGSVTAAIDGYFAKRFARMPF